MSKYTNKNNNNIDQIEEGQLPDDQPFQSTPKQSVRVQQGPEEQSLSNEIIFETVTDSEIQQRKKKKIMKEAKNKKITPINKQKQRAYQKDKKIQKNIGRFSQEREVSPSFNYPNMAPQNTMVKPPNTYLPPPMQQFYPPQFSYPINPMMAPPVAMPASYPPYMGSYMHGNMPQPYQYNMGMPMIPPAQMMAPQKPMHKVYAPQMNQQMNPQMNPQINAQMNNPMNPPMNVPSLNNQMNMPSHYAINQKSKMPINNQDFYQHNQFKSPYNQGVREWNPQKNDVRSLNPAPNIIYNQRNIQVETYSQNQRQRNKPSADRYEKPERQEKEEKIVSEATKRKNFLQDCKSQLRKHLKVFSTQQQLQILQLVKCLSKEHTSQSKEISQISKNNHNKVLNQLYVFCKQSQDKKECIYKILEQLQFDWILMELKEKPLLNWIMKDQQFMKMSQLTKAVMDSPLKI